MSADKATSAINLQSSGFTNAADTQAKDSVPPRLKRQAGIVAGIDQHPAQFQDR